MLWLKLYSQLKYFNLLPDAIISIYIKPCRGLIVEKSS
jgi:hypothetical protein